MNPRQEAIDRLGGRDARVLEPSPPAVTEGPWFADDPLADPGPHTVTPFGANRWSDVAAGDPELAAWAAERWLGPYPPLEPVPGDLADTRAELHRLAQEVLSPAREKVNGKIGLRWTRRGFGTPFFGDDRQLRIEGSELIDGAARTPIGADATFLGNWFGFSTSVLEEFRLERGSRDRVQLWPEHFDVGLEIDDRATVGGSPGDAHHPEPYFYVLLWEPPEPGPLWNAVEFAGAYLDYRDLLAADDPRELALQFMRDRL